MFEETERPRPSPARPGLRGLAGLLTCGLPRAPGRASKQIFGSNYVMWRLCCTVRPPHCRPPVRSHGKHGFAQQTNMDCHTASWMEAATHCGIGSLSSCVWSLEQTPAKHSRNRTVLCVISGILPNIQMKCQCKYVFSDYFAHWS